MSPSDMSARELIADLAVAMQAAKPIGDVHMQLTTLFNTGRIGVDHLVALGMICGTAGLDPREKGDPSLMTEIFGASVEILDKHTRRVFN